jgi:hypothetical protein
MPLEITYGHHPAGHHGELTTVEQASSPVPRPYFKPSPEAIAEVTSLLAPGSGRR